MKRWLGAEITKIDQQGMMLQFRIRAIDQIYTASRWSSQLAKYGSMCSKRGLQGWVEYVKKSVGCDNDGLLVDSHDGYKWLEATILAVEERKVATMAVPHGLVAYRVYRTQNCPTSYIEGIWR